MNSQYLKKPLLDKCLSQRVTEFFLPANHLIGVEAKGICLSVICMFL